MEQQETLPATNPAIDGKNPVATRLPHLWLCLLLDAIGCLTFLVPVLGEGADLIWAPVSAFIFYKIFGGRRGMIGGLFNLLEEALPWFDIIPTFTIMWIIEWRRQKRTSPVKGN